MRKHSEKPIFKRGEETDKGHYWVEIETHTALMMADALEYAVREHIVEDPGDYGEIKRRLRNVAEDADATIRMELTVVDRECIEHALQFWFGDVSTAIAESKVGWYDVRWYDV